MLPTMLADDRRQAGWSVEQAARQIGVGIREYRELEAGERSPSWETYDRTCKLYGWPQTFRGASWVRTWGSASSSLPPANGRPVSSWTCSSDRTPTASR